LPRSGVIYSPLFEWVKAAVWAGYKPDEFFEELDGESQSLIIAAYRTEMQITGVLENEARRESERRNRSKKHK
jgi:hypothetical protein